MQAYRLGLIPHTPLAAGLLSGKYQRNAPMPAGARMTREKRQADRWINTTDWEVVDRLTAFCEARGHSLLELAGITSAGRQHHRGRDHSRAGGAQCTRRQLVCDPG